MRPRSLTLDARFERRTVARFLCGLGGALLACIATDALGGAWRVASGELFPWRHLLGLPLYGHVGLVVEWSVGSLAGLLLLAGAWRRYAVLLGLVATAMGLSQRFSNHRALLFIVLTFVLLSPLDLEDPDFAERARPNLALVRVQLLIVYASSALHKIAAGFLGGAALTSLFGWAPSVARPLAIAVVSSEIAVPILLLFRPRAGVLLAVLLHATMAVLLPSVWPFSITMIAMSLLFVNA